ncbi:uncharacterized protein LTR77_010975 [Saxophila tyrrhenica]|uniref:DUF1996 domain-containing protein n=1 Tax=Saxophila tyrrhenica TaxID=1690608 RepID=A0AAV9NUA3_9PEZI|nr:hypothetical protein LTR77_010975 [Saxophila tyrrhenica]
MTRTALETVLVVIAAQMMAMAQQFVMYAPGGDDTSVQRIDPIIAPGGISAHVHQIFGADMLSSTLDYDSLQTASCTTVGSADFQGIAADRSIYWHPALYMQSREGSKGYLRVPTNGHKLYYLDVGIGEKAQPFEFKHGFRMLAGDPFARSPTGSKAVVWKCFEGGSYITGDDGGFPRGVNTCSDYPYLYASVEFPHCWNGREYDPEDAQAHMAYPHGDVRSGACPASHPLRLPHLFVENFFDIDKLAGKTGPDSFVLAQGDDTGYGMHQDFFNGWEDGALPSLLSTCPQPAYGNEDVGTCSAFRSSGAATACSLPVQYKENVDSPGPFLPGCNPILDADPAPRVAVAPLGYSGDDCRAENVTNSKWRFISREGLPSRPRQRSSRHSLPSGRRENSTPASFSSP